MKKLKFLLLILMIFAVAGCKKDFLADDTSQAMNDSYNALKCKPLQLKIAVISDIHYMSPSLLKNGAANGAAFQAYLAADPKLLEYSDPIFRKVISQLKRDKPDIVLIPGDLTKDGEKVCHEAIAGMLQQLAECGIKVFVIPGNHDINNPEARMYNGDNESKTPTIQASDFPKIYGNFGYKNAIFRDPNSLTYISQPYKGLWILGIDDCKYSLNTNLAIVAGVIKPETMTWILGKMQEARQKNITVLSMMHHGIVEHYTGEQQLDYGYVTDNYLEDGPKLMAAGLKVMFTGHYHANDITMIGAEGSALYDIETGSLVTPPSPYRMITLTSNGMDISTRRVTSINCPLPGGMSFPAYSNAFLSGHLDGYFGYVLGASYGLDGATATYLAPYFKDGWMAHYAGDETASPELLEAIGSFPPPLDGALYSIWTDLPPADNQLHINLK
jgi:predicted MPP superfamily phosphohydrolase